MLSLVAATSIIVDVLTLDETKKGRIWVILIKIIMLSFVTYGGIYYQFSDIYGLDASFKHGPVSNNKNIWFIVRYYYLIGVIFQQFNLIRPFAYSYVGWLSVSHNLFEN